MKKVYVPGVTTTQKYIYVQCSFWKIWSLVWITVEQFMRMDFKKIKKNTFFTYIFFGLEWKKYMFQGHPGWPLHKKYIYVQCSFWKIWSLVWGTVGQFMRMDLKKIKKYIFYIYIFCLEWKKCMFQGHPGSPLHKKYIYVQYSFWKIWSFVWGTVG